MRDPHEAFIRCLFAILGAGSALAGSALARADSAGAAAGALVAVMAFLCIAGAREVR